MTLRFKILPWPPCDLSDATCGRVKSRNRHGSGTVVPTSARQRVSPPVPMTAWAAVSRATGTLYGEQDT